MNLKKFQDIDVAGKRVFVRADLNVPMQDGVITDNFRIQAAIPTIKNLSERGARVIVASHMGRPKGKDDALSLSVVAKSLSELLSKPVAFVNDCIDTDVADAVSKMNDGDVLMLENVRFYPEEEKNAPEFAAALAANADIFVNDAFATAHRAHASTEGIAHILPAYAGFLIQSEVEALSKITENPAKPLLSIIAGAKISTKIDVLKNLIKKSDMMIIGGAMGNTFRYAQGLDMGNSLYEPELAETAIEIMNLASDVGCEIIMPLDKTVSKVWDKHADAFIRGIDEIEPDDIILDAGPDSVQSYLNAIDQSATVLWNGPIGMFEWQNFSYGSVAIARHLAHRTGEGKVISIAGGGDTVAVLNMANVADKLTYVSTAGGAFLEFIEGKILPGIAILEDK
jgi:phosphoglycerate kinase